MWSLDGCSDFIGSAGSFDGMSSEACVRLFFVILIPISRLLLNPVNLGTRDRKLMSKAVSDGEGRLGEGDAMIQVRMDENSYKPDDFDRMSDDQSISDYRNNR
ncbi:hypothetical protein COCSADRAFT_229443 [Bipolaris sorokiniana ND90Pr]|uniref:Uncharacterized protein n=1 Tax=Cochliobolus sativus (strain ND90Pr / ATCC 201652) TaxID=665912 RepID=M2SZ58_COCSN|nr:uncharacterized protein COCSADRAFT_229443 [Bipolaris sorokiniana ND90Pr]EMD62236.1 hypothetical protein COCSADRAFT_229443 [Bipolaris sorokiniana ND90Pr]